MGIKPNGLLWIYLSVYPDLSELRTELRHNHVLHKKHLNSWINQPERNVPNRLDQSQTVFKMKKEIFTGFFWLLGIAVVSLAITGLIIGFDNVFTWKIDLRLHDTYFIGTPFYLLITVFSFLNFLTLLTRSIIGRFQNNSTNIHLILDTGLLILLTGFIAPLIDFLCLKFISSQNPSGWTVFPPSIVNSSKVINVETSQFPGVYIILAQTFFLLVLIYTGIRIGRHQETHGA